MGHARRMWSTFGLLDASSSLAALLKETRQKATVGLGGGDARSKASRIINITRHMRPMPHVATEERVRQKDQSGD
eukprot:3521807-Pyramimonas_sp.AAC.2